MNTQLFKDLGIGFLFILSEVLFFRHLTIFGASADPLLFYLIWITARYDRNVLLIATAILALIQDAFFDFWGMYMFAKTLTVFITYSFVKKRAENQLLLWQVFVVILLIAFIHNIIFYGLTSFFSIFAAQINPLAIIFGNAIYTSLIGTTFYILRE